jgi:hypothetical protein
VTARDGDGDRSHELPASKADARPSHVDALSQGLATGYAIGTVAEKFLDGPTAAPLILGFAVGALSAFARRQGRVPARIGTITIALALAAFGGAWAFEKLTLRTTDEGVVKSATEYSVGGGPNSIAADGEDVVVATNAGDIFRIEEDIGISKEAELARGLFDIEVGGNAIFVTRAGRLIKLSTKDPARTRVVQRRRYGTGDCEVALAPYGVWFKDFVGGRIFLVSPQLGQPLETIVVRDPNGMAAGLGRLWVTQSAGPDEGRLLEYSKKGKLLRIWRIPADPQDVLVSGRYVWINHYRADKITRFDPTTGERRVIPLRTSGPSGITAGFGEIFVPNENSGDLSEISTQRLESIDQIEIGDRPTDVAVAGSTVYVPSETDGSVTALRIQVESLPW